MTDLSDEIDRAVKAGLMPSPDEQAEGSSSSAGGAGAAVRTAGAADVSALSASILGRK